MAVVTASLLEADKPDYPSEADSTDPLLEADRKWVVGQQQRQQRQPERYQSQ